MKKDSNIVQKKDGSTEKSTGSKVESPLDLSKGTMSKFNPIQCSIISEISRCFDRLEAERGIFAALHSWGDTLPDQEILQMFKELND